MQHPAANYEEERKVDLKRYGPWAVIIGGSEGVGASFARKLAADGFGLLLVARKIEPLTQLAEALRADGADIRILQMDVTRADFLDRVAEASADIDVGLLIYNAGSVAPASFLDTPLDSALNAVNLNVVGPLKLAHHFGRTMSARGGGGIIILGSVAGAAGGAGVAVYSGTKAFSQRLAEGLWAELRPANIDVLSLVIGTTRTPFIERAGLKLDGMGTPPAEPDDIAQFGLDNIQNGPVITPPELAEGFHALQGMPRAQAAEAVTQGTKSLTNENR
ncbi:SDR family NAD(P)-dependent oxidoreductase [Sphingobium sp. Cam5-1]|uniref:SDR family NAD(P)-dependent oxidoreductase n=1 Tax=Sphingobium sp. Cam5-1 TaxID=2789327 RepID=UPI0018AD1360|nr:SDR family NAD(P)-dependent oxidoreductase [Sphingobium sp. Cam5-1]QPI72249.1 SDR family NAD(P)-dependent oxidoreductase [Sphingobium sp. Cam5-1]